MTASDPNARETGLVTYDKFLGGAVTVVQPAKGYRAGMDAVLLAASLSARPGESLAEAGSGAVDRRARSAGQSREGAWC